MASIGSQAPLPPEAAGGLMTRAATGCDSLWQLPLFETIVPRYCTYCRVVRVRTGDSWDGPMWGATTHGDSESHWTALRAACLVLRQVCPWDGRDGCEQSSALRLLERELASYPPFPRGMDGTLQASRGGGGIGIVGRTRTSTWAQNREASHHRRVQESAAIDELLFLENGSEPLGFVSRRVCGWSPGHTRSFLRLAPDARYLPLHTSKACFSALESAVFHFSFGRFAIKSPGVEQWLAGSLLVRWIGKKQVEDNLFQSVGK